MAIKRIRSIEGLVCKVEFPCGCWAMVAQGGTEFRKGWNDVFHMVGHYCPNWKKHKRELADAERDLAQRMIRFRRQANDAKVRSKSDRAHDCRKQLSC